MILFEFMLVVIFGVAVGAGLTFAFIERFCVDAGTNPEGDTFNMARRNFRVMKEADFQRLKERIK